MVKKQHTVQNLIISTLDKLIVYVGRTVGGRQHDYALFKDQFPPELPWFEELIVLVDLGFQGILTDYEGQLIFIPFKKPRKSKANPDPTLSDEQKAVNQALASIRIRVEHAICGIKRFNIVSHKFRNRKSGFVDQVIANSAGLANFCLS